MGGNINEKNYTIKDDGTITRSRKCPKCGKELFSEGEYCEFCGSELNLKESTKKKKISAFYRFFRKFALFFKKISIQRR